MTLAETFTGRATDAAPHHALKAVQVVAVTEHIGIKAGALRSQAAKQRRKIRDLTVDAIVAASTLQLPPPVSVLTCDPVDLTLLLSDHPDVAVIDIYSI